MSVVRRAPLHECLLFFFANVILPRIANNTHTHILIQAISFSSSPTYTRFPHTQTLTHTQTNTHTLLKAPCSSYTPHPSSRSLHTQHLHTRIHTDTDTCTCTHTLSPSLPLPLPLTPPTPPHPSPLVPQTLSLAHYSFHLNVYIKSNGASWQCWEIIPNNLRLQNCFRSQPLFLRDHLLAPCKFGLSRKFKKKFFGVTCPFWLSLLFSFFSAIKWSILSI